MLVLDEVYAGYGTFEALHGVSMRVERNEIVALLGLNGAGKSTTLLTIVGAIKPTKGTIKFEGESIVGEMPEDNTRKGIALVPEGRRILLGLTVEENLRLGASVHRSKPTQVEEDLADVCARFPILGQQLRQQGTTLSGGEQQQLAIARGLMSRPKLLMLDEPSLGLAPRLIDSIFELLSELRGLGITILLVEQKTERASEIADRVYWLNKGQAVSDGQAMRAWTS